jgi:hypothetical protein
MSERENKVDQLISAINHLSDKEKRELTIKIRTTAEGIKAYTSFLYGVTSASSGTPPKEDPNCDNPKYPEQEGTETTPNSENNSSSNKTKDSEEWLEFLQKVGQKS